MIRMPIYIIAKAIAYLEPMTKNEEAIKVKEELFKIETKYNIEKSADTVDINERLAERLLILLENANLDLDPILPNDFILTSSNKMDFSDLN